MDTTTITRDQYEQALDLANCDIDLDTALLSPALKRCLEMTVATINAREADKCTAASAAVQLMTARLRRLAGSIDYQAIRSGSDN